VTFHALVQVRKRRVARKPAMTGTRDLPFAMLTAMTFALAHGHGTPAFNGLFFATAATVIPVLFLALAIQGRTYPDLVKTFHSRAGSAGGSRTVRQRFADASVGVGAMLAAVLIVFAGGAELYAFDALLAGQAEPPDTFIVYYAICVLTVGVATPPIVALVRPVSTSLRARKVETCPAQEGEEAEPSAGDNSASPDTGPSRPDAV
jgi:hypothetical protein